MIYLKLLNKKGQSFEKEFENEFLCNKFKNKVKRGKSLIIVSERKEQFNINSPSEFLRVINTAFNEKNVSIYI